MWPIVKGWLGSRALVIGVPRSFVRKTGFRRRRLLTRRASDELADRLEADVACRGWGLWALEERATGCFIGFTGLAPTDFEASFTPAFEIGWRLARSAWGSGYATEAARVAAAFAFDELGLEEIVSFTVQHNARSRAVIRRLGMRHDYARDFDHPHVHDDRLRRHVLYRLAAARSRP